MRNLEKKEWIAVAVSLFVIAFFFVFGNELVFLFNNNQEDSILNNKQATLQIQDTVVGTGDEAMVGNTITVHYTGMFADGTVFDSSVSRNEPFQFVLGMGQVIAGWDQGLAGMRVGGKRILIVPPEMGYGNVDVGPIPGGSTLIFEVELLKVGI